MAKLLHQLILLQFSLALYVVAAETEILYMEIVKFFNNVFQDFFHALRDFVSPKASWSR